MSKNLIVIFLALIENICQQQIVQQTDSVYQRERELVNDGTIVRPGVYTSVNGDAKEVIGGGERGLHCIYRY